MFFNKCTLSKNKYVLHVLVGCSMKSSLCGNYDSIRKLKAETFAAWLSQTTARTLKSALFKIEMQSDKFSACHLPFIIVSGQALITIGTDFFSPCIINTIIPLSMLPFESAPTYLPPKYGTFFADTFHLK